MVPCDQLTPPGSNPSPPASTSGTTCARAYAFSDGINTLEIDWRPASGGLFVYQDGTLQDRFNSLSFGPFIVAIRQRDVGGFEVDITGYEYFISLEFLHFATGGTARIRLGEYQFSQVNTVRTSLFFFDFFSLTCF